VYKIVYLPLAEDDILAAVEYIAGRLGNPQAFHVPQGTIHERSSFHDAARRHFILPPSPPRG